MGSEHAVYRDAVGCNHHRVTRDGGDDLPDWSETVRALASSRDVTAFVGERSHGRRQAVQNDRAAFDGRRVVSHAIKSHRQAAREIEAKSYRACRGNKNKSECGEAEENVRR